MKLDLLYLINLMVFFLCTMYFGYTVFRIIKNHFESSHSFNEKSKQVKSLDFKIYLARKDYIAYEKYQIWRFYVHG